MPTYHEILTTDLSTLTTAAERWDGMAKELNKQETAYRRDVHGITLRPTFVGESQQAANARFGVRLAEFQSAQTEAKAIASLLRDAHTQFVDLRKKLQSACEDAIAKGMKVSDQGVVSYDTEKMSHGERMAYVHDPSYQDSIHKDVASWQARIDRCVKDVDDADKGVEVAFTAVVKGSGMGDSMVPGFNSEAQGDIEKYEAQEADDIARRVAKGEKVSATDLAELRRAFRDNKGDKAFSQTFLNGLGPDTTIKFTNELNHLAYSSDKSHENVYMDLQSSLADTVANATQVPGSVADMPPGSPKFKAWLDSADGAFYRQWTQGLEKYGTQNYGSKSNPLCGYQSFVSMMQHSDTKYDDQFLYQMGDDLIAAEKTHSGLFTEWGPGHDGIRADALDGLLAMMSQNPDAATHFLDPAGNGSGADHVGNDHLHYLLNTRHWPKHVLDGMGYSEIDGPLNRTGLGAALEAAATGHLPLEDGQDPWPDMPHSDAQARVMHDVIEELKPSSGNDAPVPGNLRKPLANALAQYTNDTHEILGGMSADYVSHATGDGYFDSGGTAHMAVSEKDLVQVMRGMSEDPDAYATLHKAEARYMNEELNKIPAGETDFEKTGPLGKAGAALGAYTAIREDVINDGRMDGYSAADWKSKIAYHVIGGILTPMTIPTTAGGSIVVGDVLQRGVDTWAWQWDNDMKAGVDARADAEVADNYLDANNQAALMVDGWAHGRSDIDPDSTAGRDRIDAFKNAMLNGHDRGANTAEKYL
ncbi:hypothetical protein LK08_21645 [Streptomyces sp. MUSC 125]|uniref:DUF6571 family protein n=1 Tax=Streptomyces sp. MUSC 125 TaxID=1428624 RepID=UPI00057CF762|nr:DUF6571 family protein [Streptomyces sp. MUSC 125]KIE25121.1 hypothetical protein LK08_21645 [Streptomyces sp. MUSC 125]